jgi:hypothetical protein
MEAETGYASAKFTAAQQYAAWEQGVRSGSFSFHSSAMSYMHRALGRVYISPNLQGAGALRFVQDLGKAAHNLVAMQATALSYTEDGGNDRLIPTELDLFEQLAVEVRQDLPVRWADIEIAKAERSKVFTRLQELQNSHDVAGFIEVLHPELVFAGSQFVSAAETHGWPEPGWKSGEVTLWEAAAQAA